MLAARSPIARLASIPNMYGDFFNNGGTLSFASYYGEGQLSPGSVDIPPVGRGGRVKIAENNKALPMDRVFFVYNHFHNALDAGSFLGPRSSSVERYLIGAEKTFLCGCYSLEIRMPFTNEFRSPRDVGFMDLDAEGGRVGNLSLSLKRLLWATNSSAAAIGLGIDTPTGDDIHGNIGSDDFTIHNDSVHLLPYVGFLRVPSERLFYQGFLQLDLATNGNAVDLASSRLGKLTDQNLMYVDFSVGYWLCRNPSARRFRGLASLVELHYTTTLQDADVVSGFGPNSFMQLGNTQNRVDVLDLTVGFHAEICRTELRVAGVFPLRDESDNQFDSEVQVSVNRRF
jgi:hypothetical protein